jgi:hypothetical protein
VVMILFIKESKLLLELPACIRQCWVVEIIDRKILKNWQGQLHID